MADIQELEGQGAAPLAAGLTAAAADRIQAAIHAAIQASQSVNTRRGIRRGGRADVAERRGRVDIGIASLLSDTGLRRSEAAALTWADIERAADGSGRVTVRRSKIDQAGQGAILYVTAATTAALDAIPRARPTPLPYSDCRRARSAGASPPPPPPGWGPDTAAIVAGSGWRFA